MIAAAAKRRTPSDAGPAGCQPGYCRRLCGRKLTSGDQPSPATPHREVSRRKSRKALGIRARVRRDRGGEFFHRWYETPTGRYTQLDLVRRRSKLGQGNYQYVLSNPLRYVDPLGLFEIDPACDLCVHPFDARDNRRLSQIIATEVGTWCRGRLNEIQDINLGQCIQQSCDEGRVECSSGDGSCDDPGIPGYTPYAGGDLAHWLRRNGALPVIRTAVLCAKNPLNFAGEAGATVIHEWAHGCGYSAHGSNRIPGIPHSED